MLGLCLSKKTCLLLGSTLDRVNTKLCHFQQFDENRSSKWKFPRGTKVGPFLEWDRRKVRLFQKWDRFKSESFQTETTSLIGHCHSCTSAAKSRMWHLSLSRALLIPSFVALLQSAIMDLALLTYAQIFGQKNELFCRIEGLINSYKWLQLDLSDCAFLSAVARL